MLRSKTLPTFLLLALCISGCGTLFIKKEKAVRINSTNVSAKLYESTGKYIGETPGDFKLENNKNHKLVLKQEGYEDLHFTIKSKANNWVLASYAMVLCIPCIVDLPQKRYMQLAKTKLDFELEPIKRKKQEQNNDKNNPKVSKRKSANKEVFFEVGPGKMPQDKNFVFLKKDRPKPVSKAILSKFSENENINSQIVCDEFGDKSLIITKCAFEKRSIGQKKLNSYNQKYTLDFEIKSILFEPLSKKRLKSKIEVVFKITNNNGVVLLEELVKSSAEGINNSTNMMRIFRGALEESVKGLKDLESLELVVEEMVKEDVKRQVGDVLAITPSFEPEKMPLMITNLFPSIVTVKDSKRGIHGSGFFVDKNGYILTNQHVIDGSETLEVTIYGDKTYNATVVKSNSIVDVALLKIDVTNAKPVVLNLALPNIGDDVIAIGSPLSTELSHTTTRGIVSSNRNIEGENYIQFDAPVTGGNSGGPIFNNKGEAMGIVMWGFKSNSQLNFAIPIDEAIKALKLEIKNEKQEK